MEDIVTKHIEKTPGICGGRACLAGHRIRVMDIVGWHHKRGYSVDEIVAMFPGITLGDVHAALAYYFDHREEIEAEFQQDAEAADFAQNQYPSKVQEKLRG